MKSFVIVVLVFCTVVVSSFAQGVKQTIPLDSLKKKQLTFWNALKKNKKSTELWRNYYEVSKQILTLSNNRSLQSQQMSLDTILAEMKVQIPTSFEYNLCMWNSIVLSANRASYFKTAQELQPNDPKIITEQLYVALMMNNDSLVSNVSQTIYSKAIIPSQMMNFAYNTLISTPAGGIVLVDSDLLFEAMIVLQNAKNIRKEIPILNKRTLAENNIRVTLFQKTSLKAFSTLYDNLMSFNSIDEPFNNTIGAMVKFSQKTVCFAGNFNSRVLSAYKDSLYVVGTLYQYSPTQIDNGKILLNIWNKLRLEYLRFDLYGEQFENSNSIKQETFPIYISCSTILYNYSLEKEDVNSATIYRGFALSIAKQIGAYEDVEAYFLALDKQKSK
jgi:hypothetical protein